MLTWSSSPIRCLYHSLERCDSSLFSFLSDDDIRSIISNDRLLALACTNSGTAYYRKLSFFSRSYALCTSITRKGNGACSVDELSPAKVSRPGGVSGEDSTCFGRKKIGEIGILYPYDGNSFLITPLVHR